VDFDLTAASAHLYCQYILYFSTITSAWLSYSNLSIWLGPLFLGPKHVDGLHGHVVPNLGKT